MWQSLRDVVEMAGGQRSAKSAVCYYAGHIRLWLAL
jgi:hypothetical protein